MSTPEELKALGNHAFSDKNFKDATDYYSKAIKMDPTNHVFWSNRSASHAGLKEWTRAIEDAKECIRLAPEFLKGYYRLATAQAEMKDFTSALKVIEGGLKMDAKHPQLLKLRTTVERQQKIAASSSSKAVEGATTATTPTIQLDEATKKEFEDLQEQYQRSVREHGTVQAQVAAAQRRVKMAELTRGELQDVADDAKCYKSVGKVFLRSWNDKAQAIEHLNEQTSSFGKHESELMQKMEFLERRIKSQRENIEELLSSASAKASA